MLRLEVIGNLGQDAAVNNVNGNVFISFRVAHTNKYTDSHGNPAEETIWVSCTKNGDGGKLMPYLKKGTKVFCRGFASVRVYSSEKLRTMVAGLNLSVTEIELCGGTTSTEAKSENNNTTPDVF